MQISKKQAISDLNNILTRDNCQKTMPYIPKICAWFDSQSQRWQRQLGRVDFRSEWDKSHPNQSITHRCHTIGLAIARQCFIWAVKNTNWRPSKKVIYDLLNKVINYEGNFVICNQEFNYQWRDGGERTFLNILQCYSEEGIDIPQEQVEQLLRVLYAIRKRYYKQFFRKCLKCGVSEEAVEQIKLLLQSIYHTAKEVEAEMNESRGSDDSDIQQSQS